MEQKLRENNISNSESNLDLQGKDMLLIFDNVDNVMKTNKTQFDWFITNLLTQCPKLKIILILKKEVKVKEPPTASHSKRDTNKS